MSKCEVCDKECSGNTCSGSCRAKLSRRTRKRRSENPSECLEIRENTKMDDYIYIIQCVGSTYYKIGITQGSVDKRLKSLQTGCPYDLLMVMAFFTSNPEADEHRVHELLKQYRVRGEWFDLGHPSKYAELIFALNPLLENYVPEAYNEAEVNPDRDCDGSGSA